MFRREVNLKLVMLMGVLFCVLVSQANCEAKLQKARRGITEWRFKRMNEHAHATASANANANSIKINEYEFYLSLLPKESPENDLIKPLVFRLDLVSCFIIQFLFLELHFFNFNFYDRLMMRLKIITMFLLTRRTGNLSFV